MRNPSSAPISIKSAVSDRIRAISRLSISTDRSSTRERRYAKRFDMDEDVRDPLELLLDGDADLSGNLVRFKHGHERVNFQVKVDVILETRFARQAFLHCSCAGHLQSDITHLM